MHYQKVFNFLFLSFFIVSCLQDRFEKTPNNAVPKIEFQNMSKDIRALKSNEFNLLETTLSKKYGECYPYFIGYCLKIGNSGDSNVISGLSAFYQDKYILRLEKRLSEKFDNTKTISSNLLTDFQRLNYFLPNAKLPKNIVFMNSLFTASVNSMDYDIAVGIERYLGPKTDVIKELPEQQFFNWIKIKMLPEYLERDVLVSWIQTHIVPQKAANTAEEMINWGKILFVTEVALKTKNKSNLLRYSPKEYAWAIKNETPFWKYLINESMLFTSNERTSQNLMQDAPFTAGLPEKGPDRLGQYLGWKIVSAFMNENDNLSLQQLIETPYNQVLQAYKSEQ